MGRKNRNKNKKEKKSDGTTGNVNGGSSSSNNEKTTTTALVLTTEELDHIDNTLELAGYPKSSFFTIAFGLWRENHIDAAVDAFKRGADNVGCVPCMCVYVQIQRERGNFFCLLLPYAFEGAIRGHMPCVDYLINYYSNLKAVMAYALLSFWVKMRTEFGDTNCIEEERKEMKKMTANMCCICGKQKSEDNNVTLVRCGICKFYAYCGKDCQTFDWKERKHMHECRQVILLRKYCKPSYIKEIRDAIMDDHDPKEIHTLQRLRTKLGLNRPKEEYEELLVTLGHDDTNDTTRSPNRYEYLVGRKDGTVHIGSTPNVI